VRHSPRPSMVLCHHQTLMQEKTSDGEK
jgi:hypothetical protein